MRGHQRAQGSPSTRQPSPCSLPAAAPCHHPTSTPMSAVGLEERVSGASRCPLSYSDAKSPTSAIWCEGTGERELTPGSGTVPSRYRCQSQQNRRSPARLMMVDWREEADLPDASCIAIASAVMCALPPRAKGGSNLSTRGDFSWKLRHLPVLRTLVVAFSNPKPLHTPGERLTAGG